MKTDQFHKEKIDEFTKEIVSAIGNTSNFDEEYEKSGETDRLRNIKYQERVRD